MKSFFFGTFKVALAAALVTFTVVAYKSYRESEKQATDARVASATKELAEIATSWPEKEIESLGIRANLKTKKVGPKIHYLLRVNNMDPSSLSQIGFELVDRDSFTICTKGISTSEFGMEIDGTGKPVEFTAQGTIEESELTAGGYTHATGWALRWKEQTPSNEQ